MEFHIIQNYGGVGGLHIAYELITKETERSLFEDPTLFSSQQSGFDGKQFQDPVTPYNFPKDLFKIVSAISDTNLYPNLVTPDYAQGIDYPKGSKFSAHYDSRYRWGETVIGISLGASARITFTSRDFTSVTLLLPRRSVYIMSGDSRKLWKHSIAYISKVAKGVKVVPAWNHQDARRSIILRATKTYNTVWLEQMKPAGFEARIKAQRENWPERNQDGEALNKDEIDERKLYANDLIRHLTSFGLPFGQRFTSAEAPFYDSLNDDSIKSFYTNHSASSSSSSPTLSSSSTSTSLNFTGVGFKATKRVVDLTEETSEEKYDGDNSSLINLRAAMLKAAEKRARIEHAVPG
jgi:2OG-Fe(II) oxygenase superfamily